MNKLIATALTAAFALTGFAAHAADAPAAQPAAAPAAQATATTPAKTTEAKPAATTKKAGKHHKAAKKAEAKTEAPKAN